MKVRTGTPAGRSAWFNFSFKPFGTRSFAELAPLEPRVRRLALPLLGSTIKARAAGPQQRWMYAGGDWTVAIGGNRGVFVETAKADFNRLNGALVGKREAAVR